MKRIAIPSGEVAEEVHVIMRVLKFGQKDIDLDLIIDPETESRNWKLRVEADGKYTAVPSFCIGLSWRLYNHWLFGKESSANPQRL